MLFGRGKGPHAELEKAIGYRFRKQGYLNEALMHRSFRFENSQVGCDNQRLEFLGDAVLGMLAAACIYKRFDGCDEGTLTALRSQVTSGTALAECARALRLGEFLQMGKGEERSGGRTRANILGDALEAVIGAAYMDGGMKACEKIFDKVMIPRIAELNGDVWDTNPKGHLQELAQRRWRISPHYRTVCQEGPAHAAVFTAEVSVRGNVLGQGRGPSKQEAEKQAALIALRACQAEEKSKACHDPGSVESP